MVQELLACVAEEKKKTLSRLPPNKTFSVWVEKMLSSK